MYASGCHDLSNIKYPRTELYPKNDSTTDDQG